MSTTISRWKYMLYPELREFAPDDRARALRTAGEARFDTIELVGLIIALAVTVLITRYSATGMGLADRFGAAVGNFIVAIPLLLMFAGPFIYQELAVRCESCWPNSRRRRAGGIEANRRFE